MNHELTWKDTVLWRGRKVVGWVGRVDGYIPSIWYGRTAGTADLPFIRGEFEIEQAARDFLMFIANSESTYD